MKRYISLAFFFCSCAMALNIAPKKTDLPEVTKKAPGATYEQLTEGYHQYKVSCAACHSLYDPHKFTMDEWDKILIAMFIKAKIYDSAAQKAISIYVHAYSR